MPRPVTITDEQILEAARELFLRDGLGASTVEIARRAGVAEGSIFRRYPTKDALFRAATAPTEPPPWLLALKTLAGEGDLRDNLKTITREIVRYSQRRTPLVRLAWSHKTASGPSAADDADKAFADYTLRLAEYLQREVDGGRLRVCRVGMVARLLLGPSLSVAFDRAAHGSSLTDKEIEEFAEDLVDTIWEGISPAS